MGRDQLYPSLDKKGKEGKSRTQRRGEKRDGIDSPGGRGSRGSQGERQQNKKTISPKGEEGGVSNPRLPGYEKRGGETSIYFLVEWRGKRANRALFSWEGRKREFSHYPIRH